MGIQQLLTRRTPTALPTNKSVRSPTEEAHFQQRPRHAATLPLERTHHESAEGDGQQQPSAGKEKK